MAPICLRDIMFSLGEKGLTYVRGLPKRLMQFLALLVNIYCLY